MGRGPGQAGPLPRQRRADREDGLGRGHERRGRGPSSLRPVRGRDPHHLLRNPLPGAFGLAASSQGRSGSQDHRRPDLVRKRRQAPALPQPDGVLPGRPGPGDRRARSRLHRRRREGRAVPLRRLAARRRHPRHRPPGKRAGHPAASPGLGDRLLPDRLRGRPHPRLPLICISAPGRDGVPCGMDAITEERGRTPYARPGTRQGRATGAS